MEVRSCTCTCMLSCQHFSFPPSPTIGEDFLSDLNLKTVQCIVGGAHSKSPNHIVGVGNVERLGLHSSDPSDPTVSEAQLGVQQIRIIMEVSVKETLIEWRKAMYSPPLPSSPPPPLPPLPFLPSPPLPIPCSPRVKRSLVAVAVVTAELKSGPRVSQSQKRPRRRKGKMILTLCSWTASP